MEKILNYQNQLEKIRDLELELEDAYAELEMQLLSKIEDTYVKNFTALMFEFSDNIQQFRYVIDTFLSFKLHKLNIGDKLTEDVIDEFGTDDNIIQFEFDFRMRTGEQTAFLHAEFDENNSITDIDSGFYLR